MLELCWNYAEYSASEKKEISQLDISVCVLSALGLSRSLFSPENRTE